MIFIAFLYVLNAVFLIAIALIESKRLVWAVPWLVTGIILPIIGPIIYFLLARPAPDLGSLPHQSFFKDRNEFAHFVQSDTARTIMQTLETFGCIPFHAQVKVLENGQAVFDAFIHALLAAKDTIDVDFYIYRNDDIGKIITNILIEKAQQGIKVRFLRDGIGSIQFSKAQLERLLAAGVDCRIFHPVRFPWLTSALNQRDHGKTVIIDGSQAFVGGINIGNEYTGQDPVIGPWRDTELQIQSSDLQSLERVFEINWNQSVREYPRKQVFRSAVSDAVRSTVRVSQPLPLFSYETAAELYPDFNIHNDDEPNGAAQNTVLTGFYDTCVQTVFGLPDSLQNVMEQLFFLCLTQAKKSIHLTTPYFGPDRDLMMALIGAAVRGVQVQLLVPRFPDHKFIGLSSKTFYPELIDAGVQVFLYDKGILHAKTLVIDGDISVVGATNIDLRSFHLNREVSEVIFSHELASQLKQQFRNDLMDASLLTREEANSSSPIAQIVERGARLFTPFL